MSDLTKTQWTGALLDRAAPLAARVWPRLPRRLRSWIGHRLAAHVNRRARGAPCRVSHVYPTQKGWSALGDGWALFYNVKFGEEERR